MKKSCDCCKRYMDHLNGKMKCFHRQMSANFGHSMIIPNKFLDQFGGKISRTIELESPKGNVYVVKVTKHMNKTVLQCGWEAFVDAHQIEESDSLLFRHIENSRFEVLILDSDGCEKVFSCAGKKRTSSVQERNVDPIDISSSSHDDTTQSTWSEGFVRCESGRDSQRIKTAKLAATPSSGESGEEATVSSTSEHESSYDLVDPQTPAVPGYVLSRGTSLSEAQEEKLDMLVQDIRPEIPLYVTTIKHSNVNSHHPSLVIAKHYASEHFPRTSQTITLRWLGKNKKWHPKFYIRKDQVGYILQGHWIDFVRDNHLKQGDICIFHLRKFNGRKLRATVHLLCETKSHSFGAFHASRKRVDSRDGRTRLKVAGARSVCLTEDRRGTNGISTTSVKEEPDDDQCNNNQGKHKEPLEFDDSGGSSKPYMLSDRASLTAEQIRKVEEIVQSIQSEVPVYVSIMSKSNVGTDGLYIITFGRQFATRYLPEEEQTLTLLMAGTSKAWQVKMRPRSGDARMFTLGWRDFVRDNRLQTEDVCLFQLMSNERARLTMTVHIIRHNERSF